MDETYTRLYDKMMNLPGEGIKQGPGTKDQFGFSLDAPPSSNSGYRLPIYKEVPYGEGATVGGKTGPANMNYSAPSYRLPIYDQRPYQPSMPPMQKQGPGDLSYNFTPRYSYQPMPDLQQPYQQSMPIKQNPFYNYTPPIPNYSLYGSNRSWQDIIDGLLAQQGTFGGMY